MVAYECIELLPYILLDNAIKYSPTGEKICIKIEEKEQKQHVIVDSVGPYSSDEETKKLCNQGYRGENAICTSIEGMGIGLYTAKKICDLHNIVINIKSSDDNIKEIRKIAYSKFVVDFWIDL